MLSSFLPSSHIPQLKANSENPSTDFLGSKRKAELRSYHCNQKFFLTFEIHMVHQLHNNQTKRRIIKLFQNEIHLPHRSSVRKSVRKKMQFKDGVGYVFCLHKSQILFLIIYGSRLIFFVVVT